MDLILYTNKSEKTKINKTIETISTLSVQLKNNTSVSNPHFLVGLDSVNNMNYCYCAEFDRFYFINDIVFLSGGIKELVCSCDVLESFKTDILSSKAILKRQKQIGNMYLNDNKFYCLNKTELTTIKFPNSFSKTHNAVLVVNG